ncbi:MAG: low temperature requirement protein A [Actinobacteria bacterium]|nr:low temperature requirement protein A [Actinomycetota bacterium]
MGEVLVRPPVLRTTEQGDRSATWTELFFDLVFVVAVSRTSEILASNPAGGGLWFSRMMVLVVWSWAN